MKHRVIRKQQNSRMCLVCGLKNPLGLKAAFYELDSQQLVCLFKPSEVHQSYPGRLHGGITTAILDETVGRAVNVRNEHMMWGVTVEFTTRFKKPIPLDTELRVVGRIVKQDSRFFEGTGEIILPDGSIGAAGHGRYLKMPIEKIGEFDPIAQEWRIVPFDHDPSEIDL